ncbi:Gentisate 1,2-dioxygenase [Gallibacterium anatis]|uniref:Gentisate 1,2-dioxygenase n=1 Tax=Gallibacterium anatis TaxID=750 RepID=A0A377H3U1_9PAST|nr:cupin domain-containing protein [Gallibacterium anatis]KGQ53887.1 cupin [Gallibacterium anatis DSM 16844 = F 149]STO37174.1 Gentisate 1,2-dioxygenase [Gallibacterium anatis]
MSNLGTLNELPIEYRENLTNLNLLPLWPSMRAFLPHGKPHNHTQPMSWSYKSIRPLLLQAGELTPIEKAERRVLILANPGFGLENAQATPSIYLGLQLILPGETAPNHLHTPNAVRIIVEGEGAYTSINGEPCRMERGDLILTPSGTWHEHHHNGNGPIVWLDVLDLPLIYKLDSSWCVEGTPQTQILPRDKSFAEYSACGIVPNTGFIRSKENAPMLRYPWNKTKECLVQMKQHSDAPLLQVSYVNPENGQSLFPSIGFGALLLKAGQSVTLPKRTTPAIFHVIEGEGSFQVDGGNNINWQEKDTFCVPGYAEVQLTNTSSNDAFFITADESPLHNYLRIF